MNYIEQLRQRAEETRSIICLGMDPVREKIPIDGDFYHAATTFYISILHECMRQGVVPAIVKPNEAYFGRYRKRGRGLEALDRIREECKKLNIPVIGDVKRGDIGPSSDAYAEGLFHQEEYDFDAITVAPYMGRDSVQPFLEWCKQGKGVYILLRTSNPGRQDLQDEQGMYRKVAELVAGAWYTQGIGAVIGATGVDELEELAKFFVSAQKEVPFLIPGIGKQGGSLEDVVAALKRSGTDLRIHRINASSDINWAWEKEGNAADYAGAAVRALKRMNEIVGL